jgi:hypothetical protein
MEPFIFSFCLFIPEMPVIVLQGGREQCKAFWPYPWCAKTESLLISKDFRTAKIHAHPMMIVFLLARIPILESAISHKGRMMQFLFRPEGLEPFAADFCFY